MGGCKRKDGDGSKEQDIAKRRSDLEGCASVVDVYGFVCWDLSNSGDCHPE